ncbi:Protein SENSITIVE TO UV 2 [Dissostichus eleginoides]|uniref:Protein SENSITIVE TO UV 2 n=1 Tax=Dissostichus eleginoides TaxID=100907 RepID=A0AAD9F426_DISEL|nr:Protein SENSITIVE TO UV 2 [Dissostichus eleginoides]
MPKPALKTETKQAKKTVTAVSTASEVAGPDMASIISLLEEHRASSELAQREHRASISADFKAAFAVLEAKLNQTQITVAEHGEQIDSLETNANLQDQRLRILEEKTLACSNTLQI